MDQREKQNFFPRDFAPFLPRSLAQIGKSSLGHVHDFTIIADPTYPCREEEFITEIKADSNQGEWTET